MFDNYPDTIEYISKSGQKDMFGYASAKPVAKQVRYVGGKSVQINENNAFREENRLLYQCPFKVEQGDKFRIDGKELIVKYAEEVRDVFSKTIYWEAQVI